MDTVKAMVEQKQSKTGLSAWQGGAGHDKGTLDGPAIGAV
jgi:hypothetical protein